MLLVFILLVFCLLFSIYIIIPSILKILLRNKFLRRIKISNLTSITFDDGPDPIATPEILKILQKAGIKATFFVTGRNAEKYPDLVKKIIQEGHDIGLHGYDHIHPWKTCPLKYYLDIYKSEKVFNQINPDLHISLFRPPYGKLNIITLLFVWMRKKTIIFWNIDPVDYHTKTGEEVVNHIFNNIKGGDVILLHDGRTGKLKEKSNLKTTIDAVKILVESIDVIKNNFCTIKDAITK